jgi:RNA polymerase sigma-70 factor (ECF subfamily)
VVHSDEQPQQATSESARPGERVSPELHLVSDPASTWEAAYRENVVPLYRYVHARTGNRPDAEDVTAAVFLRALPRLRSGASLGEVRAYLYATARTVLADHWARHYSVEVGLPEEHAAAPDEIATDGGVQRARAVLAQLPANYREVLELRFLRGYSVRETARAMNVTVTNAKVLQWRALRRAAQLDPEGDE